MSYYVVDVESDGPAPALYSMHEFGAVKVVPGFKDTFYGRCRPISEQWIPEALAVSGKTREQVLKFNDPSEVMKEFTEWVRRTTVGQPIFISDNLAYDWQFINYYFHRFVGKNPFGFSGRRIGDLYCGMVKDTFARWKHLRETRHTHHPVDDAKGNAEAILKMRDMGLKVRLE